MKQLSEQELNQKIARFLEDRLSAHPEIARREAKLAARSERSVVSRVKNFSKRITSVQTFGLYQG